MNVIESREHQKLKGTILQETYGEHLVNDSTLLSKASEILIL